MESPTSEFCRACLCETTVHFQLTTRLAAIYESCTSIQLSEDDYLPRIVCSVCVHALVKCNEFIEQCHESNRKLKKMFLEFKDLPAKGSSIKSTFKIIKENQTPTIKPAHESSEKELLCKSDVISKVSSMNEISFDCVVDNDGDSNVCEMETKSNLLNEPVNESFTCATCLKHFDNKEVLSQHVKYCSDNIKMAGNHLIELNCRKKSYPEPLLCGICDMNCKNTHQLHSHLQLHSDSSEHNCQMCSYNAKDFADLLVHRYKHQDASEPLSLKCFKCSHWYLVPINLEFHYRSAHLNQPGGYCPYCDRRFSNLKNYREHLTFHTGGKDHICKICKKKFIYYKSLVSHKNKHRNIRKHICHLCGYASFTTSNLKSHLARHSDVEKIPCDECGKIFKGRINLDDHKLQYHGEKKYQCEVCSKKFHSQCLLKSHARFHSDERPYKCNACDKSYKTKSSITVHLMTHEMRPCFCTHCDHVYPNKPALQRHQRRIALKIERERLSKAKTVTSS